MKFYEVIYLSQNGEEKVFVHVNYLAVMRRIKWLLQRKNILLEFNKCVPLGTGLRRIPM